MSLKNPPAKMYPPAPPESEPPEASFLVMILNVTNTITHLCLGAAACLAFYIANVFQSPNRLSTHIYLCTFGYVILLAVGFLAFDPSSNLRRSLQYPNKKLTHLVLQLIGSVLAITGCAMAIGMNPFATSAFSTTHGLIGLVAMILTVLSFVGGVMNFFSAEKNYSASIPTLHTSLGTFSIIMALIALILGFEMVFTQDESNKRFSVAITSIGLIGFAVHPAANEVIRILRN